MVMKLTVTSSAFQQNGSIPSKYTCDGENISPPLKIRGIPVEAQSLVFICDDPDAPMGTWDHWIVWNIPPSTTEIKENTVPGQKEQTVLENRNIVDPAHLEERIGTSSKSTP